MRCSSQKDLIASHWSKIGAICGIPQLDESNNLLSFFMDKGIATLVDQIETISSDASIETSMLSMLEKIDPTCSTAEFTMVMHKDTKDFPLVSEINSAVAQLEEV